MSAVEVTPMLDVAAPVAASVESDIPSLDSTPEVDSEIPAVEPETAGAEAKVEDNKSAADAATTPITPTKIVESLQKLKAEDPAMAKALHEHVKSNLQTQKFLKENGVKDFSELKTKLSTPDEDSQALRTQVEQTDRLLYEGGKAHAELVSNIIEDLKSSVGEKAPQRYSELTSELLKQWQEVAPTEAINHQRSVLLETCTTCGVTDAINAISKALSTNDVAGAKSSVASLIKFFQAEVNKDAELQTAREAEEKKTAAESTNVESIRKDINTQVTSITNKIGGSFMAPLLTKELKGVPRTGDNSLTALAVSIQTELNKRLAGDKVYMGKMSNMWNSLKNKNDGKAMLGEFEKHLRAGIAKQVVQDCAKKMFPERFKAAPVAAPKPTTVKTTINNRPAEAFVMEKRPSNLLRNDIVWRGQELTSRDLSTLQATRQQGFVFAKDGKTPILCTWKAGVK
jgi:hypothetical protein